MNKIMAIAIICVLAIVCVAKEPFSIQENKDSFVVKNGKKIYTVNKNIFPSWNRATLVSMGEAPDRHDISMLINLKSETIKTTSLLPGSKDAKFAIVEKSPHKIVVAGTYKLFPAEGIKKEMGELEFNAYFTFIKDVPGVALDGKVTAKADKLEVGLFSATFGKDYTAYTPKGKEQIKYDKGSWKHIGGAYVIAERNNEKVLFGPQMGCTPHRGFSTAKITRWNIAKRYCPKFCETHL